MLSQKLIKSVIARPASLNQAYRSLAHLSGEQEVSKDNASVDGVNPAPKRRRRTVFSDALNKGPSFDDFVSGKAADFNIDPIEAARVDPKARIPSWLRVPIPKGESFHNLKKDVRELKLATVCEEAKCPNIGECWGGKKVRSYCNYHAFR
ncbi:unnamed protein product [Wickerhamomyces anomalus]